MRAFLKLISLILCIAMIGSVLAACHGRGVIKEGELGNEGNNIFGDSGYNNGTGNLADNGVDFDTTVKFDETSDVEITFWAKNDNNATQVEIYKKAIADFEAIYPNIKVRSMTSYSSMKLHSLLNFSMKRLRRVCVVQTTSRSVCI